MKTSDERHRRLTLFPRAANLYFTVKFDAPTELRSQSYASDRRSVQSFSDLEDEFNKTLLSDNPMSYHAKPAKKPADNNSFPLSGVQSPYAVDLELSLCTRLAHARLIRDACTMRREIYYQSGLSALLT
jgi:hypothetical protein